MTIAPIKAGGWAQGEPLTPAQINDFQAKLVGAGDTEDALDTRLDAAEADIAQLDLSTTSQAARILAVEKQLVDPDERYSMVEDFEGCIYDGTAHVISGTYNWRVGGDTGVVTINGRNGASKHPGVLEVQLPGNGSDARELYFQLGDANDGWLLPATQLDELTIVVKIENHAANATNLLRIGLVQDNSLASGGTDTIALYYYKALNATTWYLQRRKASGTSTFTALGTFTDNLYVTVRFARKANNDVDVFFNNTTTPSLTIAEANLPIVQMLVGVYYAVSSADAQIFKPSLDLLALRASPGARQGT